MFKVIANDNVELDSTYQIETISGITGLVLESWGPKDRNPAYAKAFETILSRLKVKKINHIKVYVVSRNLTKVFPNIKDRAIKIKNSDRILIHDQMIEDLRKDIGRRVGELKDPNVKSTKGGNRFKRILVSNENISESQWHSIARNKPTSDDFQPTFDANKLDEMVFELLETGMELPKGIVKPEKAEHSTTVFQRNPHVKAWVLNQANGVCEYCRSNAPFTTKNGKPYLEVHHLLPLADGGSDSVTNTIAVCPNCHRGFHLSNEGSAMVEKVIKTIDRIQKECS